MRSKYINIILICLALFSAYGPAPADAQNMADYTAFPPFIQNNVPPNLLLMIDNSASMYDMVYIDSGYQICSGGTNDGNECTSDIECTGGGTCVSKREASYCYDQTYVSTHNYVGYFEKNTVYTYNFTSNHFEAASFPAACSHKIPGELCVNIIAGSPSTVTDFAARGNYLNWLMTSKLDVQKKILTGGKYDTSASELVSESRGCVGRRFLKEALTADYVEGGTPPGSNNPLGITFAINGPVHSINPTAPSPGGQTSIQIFEGNYNEALCQEAITQINYASNPSAIRTAVEDCLSYDPNAAPGTQYCLLDPGRTCTVDSDCDNVGILGNCSTGAKSSRTCLSPPSMAGQSCVNDVDCNTIASTVGPCVGGTSHSAEVSTKIVFNQSMQECWQIWSGSKTEVGNDAFSAEAPKCSTVYAGYQICNGGTNDGSTCTSDADCTGGTCDGGPSALRIGNPAILCDPTYAGYCATTSDDWATTNWVAREYADPQECFLSKYLEYCNGVKVPPVTDPSDVPDDTAETANLPAIISDIGIESQLGLPIAELIGNRYEPSDPTGLINDFSDSIRFGAMSFNFDGSPSECTISGADSLNCARVCSSTTSRVCTTDLDCPSGETCNAALGSRDGGQIIHYIGDPIGDHDSGLIKAIGDIKANTWTPFAEAFYSAIAYFVKDATDPDLDPAKFTPSADAIASPLNTTDFTGGKNPIQAECQTNHILIISDGSSTTDINAAMKGKVADASNLYNDGDALDAASCGNYMGSSYLDDLSYYAKHRNIFDPTDGDASDDEISQRITTHVVYSGVDRSTSGGECAPKTLMENTALNGGTKLYDAGGDPETLTTSLELAFTSITDDRSSGTAVSVLSTTGEGEGAIYQAYFYPSKQDAETKFKLRKWFGYIHALFADEYGNIREDTNGNDSLDLKDDLIIEMSYDSNQGSLANRYNDTEGDGEKDALHSSVSIEDVASIWRAGDKLWEANPDPDLVPLERKIYASTTGFNMIDFKPANAAAFQPYLRTSGATPAENLAEAQNIINWVRGYDYTDSEVGFDFKPYITDAGHPFGYRERSVTPSGKPAAHVWKLGDIIYSTPTAVGKPMENYDMLYGDATYYNFLKKYRKRRNIVYIGSNDGMLHAFDGGFYDERNSRYCPSLSADGTCPAGPHPSLGRELWAFIPKGLLPHLNWLTDPAYTHVYYVDLKPKVTDVKIFSDDADHPDGWGTILIGGYRYGGKDISWTNPDATVHNTWPEYFALDITVPEKPELLWTFPDSNVGSIGLTMSYPAVLKVADKWYAVFGSGATDYKVDSDLTNFQDGNLHVLEINGDAQGKVASWGAGNYWKIPTTHAKAFMSNPITVDVDMDYNVDVIYIGENYEDGASWNARMSRITTDRGTVSTPPWTLSTLADLNAIAGARDVAKKITAAPSAAIDDQMNLWTYFGSGQYLGLDDKNRDDTGAFYAVKDRCWAGSGCTTSSTELMDVSAATVKTDKTVAGVSACAAAGATGTWQDLIIAANICDGWAMYFKNLAETKDFLNMDLIHTGERVFSKPLVIGGLVAFGAYVPGIDCDFIGQSNGYALYYKTGTAYSDYMFKEQREMASPSDVVARAVQLGKGMPSSPSGQKEKDGTVKIYFQQSTGQIITAEHTTPINIKSTLKGWKNEQIK